MRLIKIKLHNYRNFEDFSIELGSKTTVFIGRNGMGKTNMLSAMVQSLSFIFSKQKNTQQYEFIRSSSQGVKRFVASDPLFKEMKYTYPLTIEAEAQLNSHGHIINWSFDQDSEKSGLKDSKFRVAYHDFWDFYNDRNEKPVLAFFSDSFPHKEGRISSKMNEKLNSGKALPANTGYYQWDYEQSCAEIWKIYFAQEWFNSSEFPEKKTFIDAINRTFRNFSQPLQNETINQEFKVRELFGKIINQKAELMIRFDDGHETRFDLLPAGYLRMFSIVFDIACRSYLLNGHCDPEGVAFIDEIDLHLHPSLAAEVLPRLQRSFPRLQLIVSTHSPMVISNFNQASESVDDNKLYQLMKTENGYEQCLIEDIYGLDYNSSLQNVMETSISVKQADDLVKAYEFWKQKDSEKANKIAVLIKEKYGSANAMIRSLNL